MKAIENLPDNYKEIYSVNLQKNKRIAIFINALALLIAVVMVIFMNSFVPISTLFSMEAGLLNYCIRFFVLIISLLAYMCLHEFVHGMTMKALGTKKVKYGFTGLYAFAGSDDYYDKNSYIIIALAPIIIFLFVFVVINLVIPQDWFWVVYILQVCNIAGAAGDIFITIKFAKMPKDIIVRDNGVSMTVYSKS